MAPIQEGIAQAVRAAFSEEARELLGQIERSLHGLVGGEPAERGERCLEMLRGLHTLKGSAAAAGETAVKAEAHGLEERVRRIAADVSRLERGEIDALFETIERLHGHVAPPARPPPPSPTLAAPAAPRAGPRPGTEDLLRIRPERVDALHALVGELVIARLQHEASAGRLAGLRERMAQAVAGFKKLSAQLDALERQLPGPLWAPVAAARNACAPLLSGAWRELSATTRESPALLAQLAAVSANLEDGVRELRLMPLQPFCEGFARVVREAARESGREARLVVDTGSAELDRAVLVRLRDPLLHLIRNAVVHGIESPEGRRAAGKPVAGTVRVEARCEGGRAIIRISDDGAGIDVERVKQKARQAGLLDEAREPADAGALLSLLSHPGFSTRDAADGLAGRGIGLNVVAASVDELDGRLGLEHAPGQGTTFTLDVPITTSTGAGLTVRVGEQLFGILLNHVERVIRVSPGESGQLEGRSTIQVGGEPVSILPLATLLGVEARTSPPGRRPAVVLRQGRQRLVLLVDEIPGDQVLVIKPLGPAFANAQHLLGGAILADGDVLPVLHVPALFTRAAAVPPGAAGTAGPLEVARPPETLRVLVVDDSPTLRMLLRNVLQSAGYQVAVAHDGMAAIEELQRGWCDLVITDLQMPRLDGVGVCTAVRRSPRAQTPILVLTSVGAAEERQRALQAGADAYIVKSEFEQTAFLSLVAELTGDRAGSPQNPAR